MTKKKIDAMHARIILFRKATPSGEFIPLFFTSYHSLYEFVYRIPVKTFSLELREALFLSFAFALDAKYNRSDADLADFLTSYQQKRGFR